MMSTRMRAIGLAGVAAVLCGLGVGLPATAGAGTAVSNDEVDTSYGRMMLVLDSSGSMAEKTPGGVTRIAAAKTALGEVVDNLPDEAAVGLRVYGATVFSKSDPGACTDSQQVVEPGTDNRGDLRKWVASYEPYGETPIGYALREAAKDIGGEGNRSIVLVSDGEATCAPDPCKVASEITQSGIDLQVDVVGLNVTGSAREQLRCVAENGNGTYYDADSADELADSLGRVAERAVRPFTFSGTPIDGSNDPATPTPITAGEWTDEIGPDRDAEGNRYYTFERTMPGSTFHFSAATVGNAEDWEGIFVEVGTPDGSSCGTEQSTRFVDGSMVLGAVVTSPTTIDDPDEPCRTSQTLLVEVGRDDTEATENAPMAVKVMEEPPVDTVAGLPLEPGDEEYVAPQVNVEPEEIIGGSSFNDATEVSTGAYRSTIVPGEAQIFRVHLDWGQSLRTKVLFPQASQALEEKTGYFGPWGTLQTFNPMRGATEDYFSGVSNTGTTSGGTANSLGTMVVPVRYLNREGSSGAYLAGDYYISLSADEDDDGETYELPYTLQVEVVGEPAGEPSYAEDQEVDPGDLTPAGQTTDPADDDQDADTDEASAINTDDRDSDRARKEHPQADKVTTDELVLTGAVVGGSGLAVALVVVAVALLRRGRRSA
jgi:Ca-activated chloride channel family protein